MLRTAYDFTATTIDGVEQPLSAFDGQVLLVVNTASECGFTPQYEGLQALYDDYRERGLTVLGFPCDQFGNQEPGDEDEIKAFCSSTYQVTFPMFAKVDVNGDDAHPLFAWLRSERSGVLGPIAGNAIKWNFTKFLVDTRGRVVKRYAPTTKPEALVSDIEALLLSAAEPPRS